MTLNDPLEDLPQVFVFDLDYTLWPFWCDTHCSPPLKPLPGAEAGTAVKDRHGEHFGFYSHVPSILAAAREKGLKVAAASRTHKPPVADQLLRLLHVEGKPAKGYFDNLQIYPKDKVVHMDAIKAELDVEYEDMLFFDDESRNKNVERERGVAFWLVRDGVTAEEIDAGVRYWRKRRDEKTKTKTKA